jgi:hypothetical protein
MNQRKIAWIGAIAGIAVGVSCAVLGAALDWPRTPETIVVLTWSGALLGGAIGVLGGVLGTWASVKNTRGPRERAFVVRASVLCWIVVLAFLSGILLIPDWYKHLLWIPYLILLVLGIRWWNQAQLRIRQEESGHGAQSACEK